ncbi:hypothetical protein HBH56_118310 [Parastagonospora nodorum]|nr:hypothetical protein HBH56_118310 [Parastagonospora nodorum]KAH5013730.1 hypothetical protein HBI75_191930 [Parastagonospora nodorum]KAH5154236.1 hypothetical protein HBI73_062540 [Parastagonospora nodorum]KAH5676853.1 hypothetical protein HBI21_109790 [Parastagonospora nodorum]KAH5770515.1 hypothetical protein HBI16_128990 [Parastagonospora nodorum]
MTDPSRYPLRSGQDGIPGSGSGWKRAQLWVDLPSNLTASSSSVYQRGIGSDYHHSPTRLPSPHNDLSRDIQASQAKLED